MPPRFSMVVPIYKVEAYLHACIDSVLAQDFRDFEVLLVDDGSPDGCPAICDGYAAADSRITVIHRENGGLSEARNTGLSAANGDYVIFLDADDRYLSTDFLRKIDAAIGKTDCDAVFFRRRRYLEESDTLLPPPAPFPAVDGMTCSEILSLLSERDMLEASAAMKATRRRFLTDNGLYFKKGIFSEDVEWFFRYAPLLQSVTLLNCPAYCYRMREGSITHSLTEKNVRDLLDTVESHATVLRRNESGSGTALLNYMAYQYYILLGLCRSVLDGATRKKYLETLRRYRWLTQYSISGKTKKCALLVRLLGVRLSGVILGIYIKEK